MCESLTYCFLPSQAVAKLPSVYTRDEKNAVEDDYLLSIQPSKNTPGEMFVTFLYFWNWYNDHVAQLRRRHRAWFARCQKSSTYSSLLMGVLYVRKASSTLFHTPTFEQHSKMEEKQLYSRACSNLIYLLQTSTTKQKKNEEWMKKNEKMIGNLKIVGRGVCKGEWWQSTSTVLIKITR